MGTKINKNTTVLWFPRVIVAAALCVVSLGFSACEKMLDTESEVDISSASVFQTPARIEGLVNGAYKSLKSGNLYSGRLLMYGDLRGEEFVIRTENALTGGYVWEHALTNVTGDVNELWSQLYSVINGANILIAGLKDPTPVISDQQRMHYLGEAYFIRALSYFNLVSFYGRPYADGNGSEKAVPLRLNAESSAANNDLARSTTAQVYAQILADLDEAESNLPLAYETPLLNTTRAHRNTAIALKTRVYLGMADYDKVIEEARKLVPQDQAPFQTTSGVANQLAPDITDIFTASYTTGESMFSFPMTAEDPPSGLSLSNSYYHAPDFVLNTENGIIADPDWRDADKRRSFVTFDPDLNLFLLSKYLKRNPNTDYIPVIRYSEVLLNLAEAEAIGGRTAQATALLQAVRSRSDASYVFPAARLLPGNLVETIRNERRIEFLGEGLRSFDITRLLRPFPAKPSLSSFTAREVTPDEDAYVFPLPNDEILINKLIND